MKHLQISLVLNQLLCATMKQPDVGITLLDRLSAELQDETQHAVGCWVLGTKVDGQVGDVLLCVGVFVCEEKM